MPRKLDPIPDEELTATLINLQTGKFSPENLPETPAARLERERQEKFLQVKLRLERNARSKFLETDPKHVRAQVKRREALAAKRRKQAERRASRKAWGRLREADRAAALDGPTRHWRHPRRPDWIPPANYFDGCSEGPHPLTLPVTAGNPAGASHSTSAGASPPCVAITPDDSVSRNPPPDTRS